MSVDWWMGFGAGFVCWIIYWVVKTKKTNGKMKEIRGINETLKKNTS